MAKTNAQRVCPDCGEPPGDGTFCSACGRNLSSVKRLPTRSEWENSDAALGVDMPGPLRELMDKASDFRGIEEADDLHWIWGHVPTARYSPEQESVEDIIFAWADGGMRRQAVSLKIFRIVNHGGGQQHVSVQNLGSNLQLGSVGPPSPARTEALETQEGDSVIDAIRENCADNPPNWIADLVTTWWPPAPDKPDRVEMKCYRITRLPKFR